jgi:hypothetical protein
MNRSPAAKAGSGRALTSSEEDLAALEERSHSFLLRLWVGEGAAQDLRGYITHVQGNERGAVHSFAELEAFIRQFLISSRSKGRRVTIVQWLRKLMPNTKSAR